MIIALYLWYHIATAFHHNLHVLMHPSYYGEHSMLPDDAEYVSMANWTAYPYSRGHIHIASPDVNAPIDFDVGYLKDANDIDLKKHIWAYKLQREMWRRMSISRGELASSHPRFPAGSKAAVVEKQTDRLARARSGLSTARKTTKPSSRRSGRLYRRPGTRWVLPRWLHERTKAWSMRAAVCTESKT